MAEDSQDFQKFFNFERKIRYPPQDDDSIEEDHDDIENVLFQEYMGKTSVQKETIIKAISSFQQARAVVKACAAECVVAKVSRTFDLEDHKHLRAVLERYRNELRVYREHCLILKIAFEEQAASIRDIAWIVAILGRIENELKGVIQERVANNVAAWDLELAALGASERKTMDVGNRFTAFDEQVAKLRKQDFPNELLDSNKFGRDWVFARLLPGGISKAGLWIKLDANQNIVDRIVKKNEYHSEKTWMSSRNWYGDPKDATTRIPLEFALQNRCADASRDHFVRLRHWSQDHNRMIVSQYVEWCPHGDLEDISSSYRDTRRAIPEPVVVYIFMSLIQACLVMQHGTVRTTPNVVSKWKQIVHRDIKDGNIFMDASFAGKKEFPAYPTPKMADFGLAFETSPDDPFNPRQYNVGAGTRPFRAPEQLRFRSAATFQPKDDWKLLAHTNVYGIGATMWDLVSYGGLRGTDEPQFGDPNTRWKMSEWTKAKYSEKLLRLIDQCVEWDPADRPQLQALQKAITDHIRDGEGEQFDYMRDARDASQPPEARWDIVLPQEKYKLGFARPA